MIIFMKKIFLLAVIFVLLQPICFAQTGITFLYINGSNNNDLKMQNWYEAGVKKLHPYLKKEFTSNALAKKYFLKNDTFLINDEPAIFFWGDKSHEDLTFVKNNLEISKSFSSWSAYQIRAALTKFLHDAIWVQKYHNMSVVLTDLHKMVKKEAANGNKVVLYGYSAGSFVTYEYLLTRLPFINVNEFFDNVKITQNERKFVLAHPMKNTCMIALGQDLAVFSAAGHIVPNTDEVSFKQNYLNLDNHTDNVCAPYNTVKGIVNFASPLVLFYSDLSDPNYDLTYYNRLLFKYIIENDMFWLTVNYRADPLGFPGGKNLTIEEMEKATNLDIEPHAGFIYDQSDTWGRNSAFATHTSYWNTSKIFSRAVVRAYVNGYRHQYDDNFKQNQVLKYQNKYKITP